MDNLAARLFSYWKWLRPADRVPASWKRLAECRRSLTRLLHENRYLAVSDVSKIMNPCSRDLEEYRNFEEQGILPAYCRRYHISCKQVSETLHFFDRFHAYVSKHNHIFLKNTLLSEKDYFDHILDDIDPSILLDEDQRRMVITDEDYCLVIAGAGAGKTTAVAAKVKYLTEKLGILPGEILVISFTNKAVAELRQRIQKNLGINCPIATFHSTGNAILRKDSDEQLNVADPSLKYTSIMEYFQRSVLRDSEMVHKIVLFFSYYIDPPIKEIDPEEFFRQSTRQSHSTLRSELGDVEKAIKDIRSGRTVTIQNEILRSKQEVEIANFLYLHGIDYEYEPLYPYPIQGAKKPYTPDFRIRQGDHCCYLEHFGISEDGENARYSEEELTRYRTAVNRKVLLHRAHGTELLYTFSTYRDGRSLTDHLAEQLVTHGFEFHPPDEKELLKTLFRRAESHSVKRFVLLIARFITNFKTDGYSLEDFDRMLHTADNVRSKLFLEICRACYLEYERILTEQHATDFEDMINRSVQILKKAIRDQTKKDPENTQNRGFKYVIVDEYQDISRQRFDLVRALKNATGARIVAVGDDWQSIYAFSGSDITLFTKFQEKMGYGELLQIRHTYRNAQELIDIAGGFIQKNSSQLIKSLKSSKTIEDPIRIISFGKLNRSCGGAEASASMTSDSKNDGKDTSNLADAVGNAAAAPTNLAADAVDAAMAPTNLAADAVDAAMAPTNLAAAAEMALDEIAAAHGGSLQNLSILMLGRFGFDGYNLCRSDRFSYRDYGSRIVSKKYPQVHITYMTAHASKGLGYDEVILLNSRDERYGFPAKIDDDPVLSFVVREDHSYDYAEERRLFYVALTRTKNRVYLLAPAQNPSPFLKELLQDNPEIKVTGRLNLTDRASVQRKCCPLCGYPLTLRFKEAYGLPLYLCTNEPEICGFMTNDLRGGTLQIQKCDSCKDGFLIVKRNRKTQQMFLGCTNYRPGGKGCNRSI